MTSILHIGYFHRYDDTRIVFKECTSLKERFNCKVSYITSSRNGYSAAETINGINIKIIPLKPQRFIRLFQYMNEVKKFVDTEKPDICHIHEFMLWPLIRHIKRRKITVFLDLHENDIYDISERLRKRFGNAISKLSFLILKLYEKHCIKAVDGAISVTPQIIARISKYIHAVEMIANFPSLSLCIPKRSIEQISSNANTICFAGNISELWGIDFLVNAIRNKPDVKLILAGRAEVAYIEQLLKKSSQNQVKYLGVVNHSEVLEKVYNKSGIGAALLCCKGTWLEEGTLGNTKIFEYMQAGIPVICTDFPIWKEIVEGCNCGIVVNPYDISQIVDAIQKLRSNPNLAYELGRNGQRAILEKYNWENEAEKLITFYKMNGSGLNEHQRGN